METIRSCHTLRNTLQIVVILLPPLTKYFSALNYENGGYLDKAECMILRDHHHRKLTCLCITLVANIIRSYRKSVSCSDYIFFNQVIRLFILRRLLMISFVRSASLPTISLFPQICTTYIGETWKRFVGQEHITKVLNQIDDNISIYIVPSKTSRNSPI